MQVQPDDLSAWERLFWSVFHASSNPMAVVDGSRQIIDANAATAVMLGYARDDLVGRLLPDFVTPDERAAASADWDRFVVEGHAVGERCLMTSAGEPVHVSYCALAEQMTGRRLALYVTLPRDREDEDERPAAIEAHGVEGAPLTARELEVVHLVAMGLTGPQIAQRLVVSPETVRSHIKNAMSKAHAHTRAQLVAIALGNGMLNPEEQAPVPSS